MDASRAPRIRVWERGLRATRCFRTTVIEDLSPYVSAMSQSSAMAFTSEADSGLGDATEFGAVLPVDQRRPLEHAGVRQRGPLPARGRLQDGPHPFGLLGGWEPQQEEEPHEQEEVEEAAALPAEGGERKSFGEVAAERQASESLSCWMQSTADEPDDLDIFLESATSLRPQAMRAASSAPTGREPVAKTLGVARSASDGERRPPTRRWPLPSMARPGRRMG